MSSEAIDVERRDEWSKVEDENEEVDLRYVRRDGNFTPISIDTYINQTILKLYS